MVYRYCCVFWESQSQPSIAAVRRRRREINPRTEEERRTTKWEGAFRSSEPRIKTKELAFVVDNLTVNDSMGIRHVVVRGVFDMSYPSITGTGYQMANGYEAQSKMSVSIVINMAQASYLFFQAQTKERLVFLFAVSINNDKCFGVNLAL